MKSSDIEKLRKFKQKVSNINAKSDGDIKESIQKEIFLAQSLPSCEKESNKSFESADARNSRCQKTYGLSYHASYAFRAEEEVILAEMDVLEVGGSMPRDFVLQELKVKSWTGIESPEYSKLFNKDKHDHFTAQPDPGSTLPDIDKSIEGFLSPDTSPGAYTICYANIEDLPESHYERYDRIFSIACFEHILHFPQALEKMYQSLKPGGRLFSMFSPIWSSHNGHHLPYTEDAQGKRYFFNDSPIPPWGHLTMRPAQMSRFLRQKMDAETADKIVYLVYNSPHINRFFTEDFVEFVQQSPFKITKLEATFPAQINASLQQKLEQLHPERKYFSNNGLLMVLDKL